MIFFAGRFVFLFFPCFGYWGRTWASPGAIATHLFTFEFRVRRASFLPGLRSNKHGLGGEFAGWSGVARQVAGW